jgi:hypothetical protein
VRIVAAPRVSSSIRSASGSLPLDPSEHISLAETPVFAEPEPGNAIGAPAPCAFVHPGNRQLQQLGHVLDREELLANRSGAADAVLMPVLELCRASHFFRELLAGGGVGAGEGGCAELAIGTIREGEFVQTFARSPEM